MPKMTPKRAKEIVDEVTGVRRGASASLSLDDHAGRSTDALAKFWQCAPSDATRRDFETLVLQSGVDKLTIQAGFEAAVAAMRRKTAADFQQKNF